MTKMWKVVYGQPAPVEVQAKNPSYPHRDESGDQIFENTHFLDIDKAWVQHLAEHRASLSLAAQRAEDVEARLKAEGEKLCEASRFYNAAQNAFGEFLKQVPRHE